MNTTVPEAEGVFARFPELYELLKGNREFVEESEKEDPGLIEELAGGQHPKVSPLRRKWRGTGLMRVERTVRLSWLFRFESS